MNAMTEHDTYCGEAEALSMGTRLWRLLELETARRKAKDRDVSREEGIRELRMGIPQPMAKRFDFRMERGMLPVVRLQAGRCGSCFISLSREATDPVEKDGSAGTCDFCGALVVSETVSLEVEGEESR